MVNHFRAFLICLHGINNSCHHPWKYFQGIFYTQISKKKEGIELTDKEYMLRAISLAKKGEGWTNPNPMVGAVIVREG